MLNWVIRYAPVVRFLKRVNTTDVLEVGSGSWGLAEYVDFPVTGCDVVFHQSKHERLHPIVGTITDLPFSNAQFDCVVCLDTLEHIPPDHREKAIRELIRVASRYLVVGCPTGASAHNLDRALHMRFIAQPSGAPEWLDEHMEHPFPQAQEIARVLAEGGLRYRTLKSENLWLHYFLTRAERARFFSGVLLWLSKGSIIRRYFPTAAVGAGYRTLFFVDKKNAEAII